MDKNKIIAVLALVVLGGLLLFAKSKDPAAPSESDGDAAPQPTAALATDANSTPTDANATDANATDANATDANATNANATDANAAPAVAQADVTELKIINERVGTGPVAKSGDNLSMNYKGTLTNGEVFDQSYGREPFDFQLGAGNVIQGWDKGIVGMKVGGKRKLIIPPSMGYKERGQGPIPPNATLIFEVELLSVNGKS